MSTTIEKPKRKVIPNQTKINIVQAIDLAILGDVSVRRCCDLYGIQPNQYRLWKKNLAELKKRNGKAKSSHPGRQSILSEIDDELLQFVFEHREQGMAMSVVMIAVKASALHRPFREKTMDARVQSV